jgi:hypothetical protein
MATEGVAAKTAGETIAKQPNDQDGYNPKETFTK